MLHRLRALPGNTRAATALEYGLIASLIVIAMVGAMAAFAGKANSMWGNIATAVTTAG